MVNTNFDLMVATNTRISFQDHNGNLEVIPSDDDFLILTPAQVADLIAICARWLAGNGEENAAREEEKK